MNPLQSRLAAMRRRLRLVVSFRGLCVTAAALLAGLCLAGLFDAFVFNYLGFDIWSLLRAAFLVGTLAVAGAACYWLMLRPLTGRTDDLSLALRVEEHYPILNDALASTVQFLEAGQAATPGTSPSLQKEAVQRALRLAQGCDFNKAVSPRGLGLSFALFLAVLAAVLPLLMFQSADAKTALARALDPFGDHPWVGKTRLRIEQGEHYPNFLAIGQPLWIKGEVDGVIPAKAEIEFDDASLPMRQVDIREATPGHGNFLAAGIKVPTYRRDIRFRVRANNAVSPAKAGEWHLVLLREPPRLVSLDGKPSPQITIRQPRYTGLPELIQLTEGTGNLDVWAGSHVTLRAGADRPLQRAFIEFKPFQAGAKEALLLAALGPRHPVEAVTTTGVAGSGWARVPAAIGQSGTDMTIPFVPSLTGAYLLTIQDKDGLSKTYEFDLNVKPDPVPRVTLLRPSASQSVLANAEVNLQIMAEDDIFALRTVYLEYRRKDKNGTWIDAVPQRRDLFDNAKTAAALTSIGAAFAPFSLPAQPVQLRPKRMVLTQRWSLKSLAMEGDTIVIQACAEDFNNVLAFPEPGRSHEIELKVVPKTGLATVLDEYEAKIQQQLLKLHDMQEQALKKVIGAEQQWRETGKLRPEDLVELAEADQLQQEIQARIGTKKDEGLRGDLGQVEELLKDNKLPKSEVGERVKGIREDLERISRETLPKIEPKLSNARRDLENPEKPKVPGPKEPGDLGSVRADQEKVQQTLEDLLKIMEEQATFQQLKGELRAILQEQQERQKEVEKLLDLTKDFGPDAVQKNDQFKAELGRTSELQRRLGDRTEKLIDALEQLSEKKGGKDPGLAEMLDRAVKIGKDEKVVGSMRETADKLRVRPNSPPATAKGKPQPKRNDGPNLNSAHATQGKDIATLEKMLEALDQTRADEIERLIVRQKQEQKNLNDLAAKMKDLQQEIEKAKKIVNPNDREEKLKQLGKEMRNLQKQVEENARDLAGAQAREAANELKEAARKLDRVLRELDRGNEPDEALRQAQDNIEAAKNKLNEARQAIEEELAREQIAKIVDKLKGLKERQDAIVTETERLRKTFLLNSKWTENVKSLTDLPGSQNGVAAETAFLKDKLKGAKIYHALLDRSHQDMTKAAERASKWATAANLRLRPPRALNDDDFTEEKTFYEATLKLEKSASERLQRLIDALLPELEAAKQAAKQEGGGGGGGEGGGGPEEGGPKGGIVAQDGIPGAAQLKVLKAEQLDVNARTKEFAELHPNADNLTPGERTELDAIHVEQDRLLQLFRELMTAAQVEGGK